MTRIFGLILLLNIIKPYDAKNDLEWTLSVSTHDLELVANSTGAVTFTLESQKSRNGDSFTILFESDPPHVISTIPKVEIKVPSGGRVEFPVEITALHPGVTTAVARIGGDPNSTNHRQAYIRLTVNRSNGLHMFSAFVGWMYVLAWAVSFYPQMIKNFKRKSVVGLNFDFLCLNTVGHSLYLLYNLGLYAVPSIQAEYFKRHPLGVNPVQLNDVIFPIHSTISCLATIVQCFIYEKGTQKVSKTCQLIVFGIGLFTADRVILTATDTIKWLDMLYFFSFVKLFITLVKYVPQAYMNFRRKSTDGWAIGNTLLDFTGGILSIMQMALIAYDHDDWSSLYGNSAKLGLGLFSVIFDVVFMFQHYVLYRNVQPVDALIRASILEEQQETLLSDSEEDEK